MSIPSAHDVSCPDCAGRVRQRLHDSLNGSRAPAQVLQILDGTFELARCADCGLHFQPEHTMQFVDPASGTWIYMFPRSDRHQFVELEGALQLRFERTLRAVPPLVASTMRLPRLRLVFGQAALTEAVRLMATDLDWAMVECAKLELFSARSELFAGLGPVELIYRSSRSLKIVDFGIHGLDDGDELGAVELPADYLSRLERRRASFVERFPKLFQGPFISASRYLHRDIATLPLPPS